MEILTDFSLCFTLESVVHRKEWLPNRIDPVLRGYDTTVAVGFGIVGIEVKLRGIHSGKIKFGRNVNRTFPIAGLIEMKDANRIAEPLIDDSRYPRHSRAADVTGKICVLSEQRGITDSYANLNGISHDGIVIEVGRKTIPQRGGNAEYPG